MDHDPTRELEQSGATGSGPCSGLSEGEYFGRYMVLERVGAGGMGVVYAAYDPTLDRRVALKILARAGTQDMPNQRLLREAQAMARLAHPHVATVHEAGEVEGRAFVAMEYLSGGDLHDWLKHRERGWDEIRPVFVAAGQGLAAAHRSGLVHRDFKPSNVMFGGDGRVRVTDFGLARLAEDSQDASFDDLETRFTASDSSAATPLSSPLTREGLIVGTPAYMAPEQILNGRADPRTDQFAFAVSLWEALTGSRPFRASGDFAEMVDHASTYEARPCRPSGARLHESMALFDGRSIGIRSSASPPWTISSPKSAGIRAAADGGRRPAPRWSSRRPWSLRWAGTTGPSDSTSAPARRKPPARYGTASEGPR
jgi:serine/threonine protein kinase